MLRLNDICKVFNKGTVNETRVFEKFGFTVGKGEFVSIVGSNGSGKTTILNIVSGNMQPDSGEILLDGKNITKQKEYMRARKIGRVFQDPSKGTANTMTIAENMAIADNKGKPFNLAPGLSKKRLSYYKEQLSRLNLGLEDKLEVKVGALSGGQRQALTLLVSTLTPIDLLLLDEHTASLDPRTSEEIMALTGKIVRDKGITVLMVTHNLRFAVEYGNRLLMFDKGHIVIDKKGSEKENIQVSDILRTFNEISIECGI